MRSWTGKNAFLGLLAVVLSLPLPAVAQVVGEIPIPVGNANPRGIVLGQDSNFWFSAYGVDQIGRMTPDGTFTFFTLPPVANQTFLGPEDIVSGLDGALYFIETQPGAVKRITTAGGISSLPFQPSINTNLIGKATHIVAHSDGLLWFTIQSTQAIGRMTTAGTGAEVYGDPSSGNPSAIASGPDGAIWYTSDFGINKVTGINIQNRLSADLYRFPSNNVPVSIVAGPDGAMWAATSGNTIARVTTSGQVTEFTIPSPFMRSDHITTGADGALWFAATTSTTEKVGRMTTSGVYSEFDVGAAGSPRSFATGPDSALWLTQASGSGTDNIGRLVVAKTAQTISFTSAPPANATVGGATYTPSATATSSLAVSFAIDVTTSSVCSIAAGVVSFSAPGNCVIYASQPGDANYNSAQAQQTVANVKGAQSVTFTSTAPTDATPGGPAYLPTAIASSGLTVTISIDGASAAVCSYSGVVNFNAAGTCIIDANQSGDANYGPAPQVQQSISVAGVKTAQTISFTSTPPTHPTVGGPTYTPMATATSSLPVALTVDATRSSICSISAGVVSFSAAGSCVIDANQAGNATFNAAPQVQQTIFVGQPASAHTWVSRNGSDSNPCTVAAPCQTFQAAHDVTSASGEINCLNSGDYGQFTITKSITIRCSGLLASVAASSGAGIMIAAGAADKIVLDGLDIEGLNAGAIGILVGVSSKVHVLNTTVRNFSQSGIQLNDSNTHLFLDNSFVIGNPTGVFVGGTNNIASLTSSSVRASPTASLNAATGSAIIGVQNSVINDSPMGIARAPGALVISVGPSNLLTGAGTFTSTIPYE